MTAPNRNYEVLKKPQHMFSFQIFIFPPLDSAVRGGITVCPPTGYAPVWEVFQLMSEFVTQDGMTI
jgi:hypothetical protein